MSKCRFGGAEGTDQRVLAENTDDCRVQETRCWTRRWDDVMKLARESRCRRVCASTELCVKMATCGNPSVFQEFGMCTERVCLLSLCCFSSSWWCHSILVQGPWVLRVACAWWQWNKIVVFTISVGLHRICWYLLYSHHLWLVWFLAAPLSSIFVAYLSCNDTTSIVWSWSPWRKNWAGSTEWTAAVISKGSWHWNHWIWLDETRAKWPWRKRNSQGLGPENPLTNSQVLGPKNPWNKSIANSIQEFTKQLSVTAVTKQREEWVQMFQKLFHRVRMWMRPEGLEKTSTQRRKVQNTMVRISSQWHAWDEWAWRLRRVAQSAASTQSNGQSWGEGASKQKVGIPQQQWDAHRRSHSTQQWDAHRKSHNIQQKSMHRKRDKEDSRHSAEDQYWQSLDATRLITAQQCKKTERHVNQLLHIGAGDLTANNDHAVAEYHTVMLEIPVYHAVAEYSERKTDPMFSLRVDWHLSAEKDNGEFGTSRKLVGTSVRLVGGEWKIHYVRRTRDVAGRNRKHQDRVKRKGTRWSRRGRSWGVPDAVCGGPCKQREVNRRGAERGTTLEELQENVNQKILEVTRNKTANDGKHRDELPQTRRRKAVSVWDEAENYRDENETNKLNIETVWSGESKAVKWDPNQCAESWHRWWRQRRQGWSWRWRWWTGYRVQVREWWDTLDDSTSGKKLNDVHKNDDLQWLRSDDETQVKTIWNKCQGYNFSHVNRSWKCWMYSICRLQVPAWMYSTSTKNVRQMLIEDLRSDLRSKGCNPSLRKSLKLCDWSHRSVFSSAPWNR